MFRASIFIVIILVPAMVFGDIHASTQPTSRPSDVDDRVPSQAEIAELRQLFQDAKAGDISKSEQAYRMLDDFHQRMKSAPHSWNQHDFSARVSAESQIFGIVRDSGDHDLHPFFEAEESDFTQNMTKPEKLLAALLVVQKFHEDSEYLTDEQETHFFQSAIGGYERGHVAEYQSREAKDRLAAWLEKNGISKMQVIGTKRHR